MPWWAQALLTLVSGGAAGAVITAWIAIRRSRQQVVRYKIEVDSVFSSEPHSQVLKASATVVHDGDPYKFDELGLVRIEVNNDGNRDLESFAFGVTLDGGHEVILAQCSGEDRHHGLQEVAPKVSPGGPRKSVDFTAVPFNRRDHYSIRLYMRSNGPIDRKQVQLSSAEPVVFAEQAERSPVWRESNKVLAIVIAATFGAALGIIVAPVPKGMWIQKEGGEVYYVIPNGSILRPEDLENARQEEAADEKNTGEEDVVEVIE